MKQVITHKGTFNFNPIHVSKKHNEQSDWKRVALIETNDDLEEYYRWFLCKRFNMHNSLPSIRGGHITFISDRIHSDKDVDDNFYLEKYNIVAEKYHDTEVEFNFDVNNLRSNGKHWWYNINCDIALDIRSEIGFERIPYFGLHFTIARFDVNNKQSYQHSCDILNSLIFFENGE